MAAANPTAKYIEKVKGLRYIDDLFFGAALEDYLPGIQLILRIVMEDASLQVHEVHTQQTVANLYGRGVRFDVFASADGKRYNCEIQRENGGAIPLRARYNSAMMDAREISKGTEYEDFPENIVIFICEHDVLGKGLPLYHIRRVVEETGERFSDKALIIYVNGRYRGDDPLGRLMHDFFCEKPEEMHYSELAARMKSVKENEGSVNKMCNLLEEAINEGRDEGESKLARLISILLRNGKTDDIALAAEDVAKRQELYRQYGIA